MKKHIISVTLIALFFATGSMSKAGNQPAKTVPNQPGAGGKPTQSAALVNAGPTQQPPYGWCYIYGSKQLIPDGDGSTYIICRLVSYSVCFRVRCNEWPLPAVEDANRVAKLPGEENLDPNKKYIAYEENGVTVFREVRKISVDRMNSEEIVFHLQ